MKLYQDLLREILTHGTPKEDRTGTGLRGVFGRQLRFNLQAGFPLLTTKKLHIKSIIHELLWFLKGDTNIRYLNENGVTIWDEWADAQGNLGPIYGHQWRLWKTPDGEAIDQIAQVIHDIVHTPESRRLIVSAWNVADLPHMKLPPCHCLFQFYVARGELSCQLYQRSCDVFLGLPFNIASYALLTHMVAAQCDLNVGEFIWTGGDIHLYNNHIEQAMLQMTRTPYESPTLRLTRRPSSIFEYRYEDFLIENYVAHPSIKAKIAV